MQRMWINKNIYLVEKMFGRKMIIQNFGKKKWTKKIQEKKVGQKLCHLKNYSLHLIRVKSDWPDFSYQNFG